jgi:predicted SnoaL-like aldol condensation-catalyzing enzyme
MNQIMKSMKFIFLMAFGMFSNGIYSQQNPSTHMSNQEIVERFLEGFNDPTKIQGSLDLLTEDYQFKNPMVELNSKAAFIQLAQEMGKVLTGVKIIRIIKNDDWVAVFYEFKSSIPGVQSNMATEWFRLEDGMIKESHLIYDASEWRKIYEKMGQN